MKFKTGKILVNLNNEELCLIHSALEYMADNYDLYKAEETKTECNKLRFNLGRQFAKQDKLMTFKTRENTIRIDMLEKVRDEFERKFIGINWEDDIPVPKVCYMIHDVIDNLIEENKNEGN